MCYLNFANLSIGVWFQKCLTVGAFTSGKEVPEMILRTVRVSVTTRVTDDSVTDVDFNKSSDHEQLKVKIGILVAGTQDNFEHIQCVRTRNYVFDINDEIVNFDDLVDHDDLINDKPKSNFLSGEDKNSFKILVTITPLSKLSSLCVS